MDLTYSESESAFRDELRAWLDANDPGSRAGRRDRHYAWRRDWQRRLYDGGWAAVHWPKEFGGRGASVTQSAIFYEELSQARAPLPANVLGILMGGPTLMAWGDRGAEGALPDADPVGRGDLVPGLQRARGRLGPRGAEDARRAGRRRLGRHRAEGLDLRRAHSKWCMLVARTDIDAPKHKGLTYFLMDMEQDARRGPAAAPDHRRGGVQRALHRGGADPRRERRRRRRQRLEGRADDAHERALGARLLPPGSPAPAARRADRGGRHARAARGSGDPPAEEPDGFDLVDGPRRTDHARAARRPTPRGPRAAGGRGARGRGGPRPARTRRSRGWGRRRRCGRRRGCGHHHGRAIRGHGRGKRGRGRGIRRQRNGITRP